MQVAVKVAVTLLVMAWSACHACPTDTEESESRVNFRTCGMMRFDTYVLFLVSGESLLSFKESIGNDPVNCLSNWTSRSSNWPRVKCDSSGNVQDM